MQPEAFGLHSNADITKDLAQADAMTAALLLTNGGAGGGGGGGAASAGVSDKVVGAMAADILARLPAQFDVEKAQQKCAGLPA